MAGGTLKLLCGQFEQTLCGFFTQKEQEKPVPLSQCSWIKYQERGMQETLTLSSCGFIGGIY